VRDDSDVADVAERRSAGHEKFRLDSGSWIGKTPIGRGFSRREW
jgi:hypothetical protein